MHFKVNYKKYLPNHLFNMKKYKHFNIRCVVACKFIINIDVNIFIS